MIGVALGFFGGVASGLFGVGGGIITVPILTLGLKIEMHFAVSTSMFTMTATSFSGAIQHYALGNINFEYALFIGIVAAIGAQVGAYTSKRISGMNLQIAFGLMLLAVSVRMVLRFI